MGESYSIDFSMVEYSWEKKYFRNVIIEIWIMHKIKKGTYLGVHLLLLWKEDELIERKT